MKVLITGAAGNLGSHLARSLLPTPHDLRLLIHRHPLPADLSTPSEKVSILSADLSHPAELEKVCTGIDCIVHLAGVLFAPHPERFLPKTNIGYVQNLVQAAKQVGVKRFILLSFPHVEGETTPEHPARGGLDAVPSSVHARTRLAAEKYLLESCNHNQLRPVILRAGVIYGRDVKLIEAARWMLRRRLMAIWKKPTWLHLLSLPDLLVCIRRGIELDSAIGIYNLCDDQPILLQDFLDRLADHWGYPHPLRLPEWTFYLAASSCETFATVFRTPSPLTRDILKAGMTSVVADTSRMKTELLPSLQYPTLTEGLELL